MTTQAAIPGIEAQGQFICTSSDMDGVGKTDWIVDDGVLFVPLDKLGISPLIYLGSGKTRIYGGGLGAYMRAADLIEEMSGDEVLQECLSEFADKHGVSL